MYIQTSHATYAGTLNTIYASFQGDFAASGPHAIGVFEDGSFDIRYVTLDRAIGKLQYMTVFNNSTDGWLFNRIECDIEKQHYMFHYEKQWLDTLDYDLLSLYGNGHEPYSQETSISGSSTIKLLVKLFFPVFQELGAYKPQLTVTL
jgi:hypothetical protein